MTLAIVVGEREFDVDRELFLKDKKSVFYEIANRDDWNIQSFYFDEDPDLFELILNFLRTGSLPETHDHLGDLFKTSAKFRLASLRDAIINLLPKEDEGIEEGTPGQSSGQEKKPDKTISNALVKTISLSEQINASSGAEIVEPSKSVPKESSKDNNLAKSSENQDKGKNKQWKRGTTEPENPDKSVQKTRGYRSFSHDLSAAEPDLIEDSELPVKPEALFLGYSFAQFPPHLRPPTASSVKPKSSQHGSHSFSGNSINAEGVPRANTSFVNGLSTEEYLSEAWREAYVSPLLQYVETAENPYTPYYDPYKRGAPSTKDFRSLPLPVKASLTALPDPFGFSTASRSSSAHLPLASAPDSSLLHSTIPHLDPATALSRSTHFNSYASPNPTLAHAPRGPNTSSNPYMSYHPPPKHMSNHPIDPMRGDSNANASNSRRKTSTSEPSFNISMTLPDQTAFPSGETVPPNISRPLPSNLNSSINAHGNSIQFTCPHCKFTAAKDSFLTSAHPNEPEPEMQPFSRLNAVAIDVNKGSGIINSSVLGPFLQSELDTSLHPQDLDLPMLNKTIQASVSGLDILRNSLKDRLSRAEEQENSVELTTLSEAASPDNRELADTATGEKASQGAKAEDGSEGRAVEETLQEEVKEPSNSDNSLAANSETSDSALSPEVRNVALDEQESSSVTDEPSASDAMERKKQSEESVGTLTSALASMFQELVSNPKVSDDDLQVAVAKISDAILQSVKSIFTKSSIIEGSEQEPMDVSTPIGTSKDQLVAPAESEANSRAKDAMETRKVHFTEEVDENVINEGDDVASSPPVQDLETQ